MSSSSALRIPLRARVPEHPFILEEETEEGRLLERSLASRHWAAHAAVPPALQSAARRVQAATLQHPDHLGSLSANNVANVRPDWKLREVPDSNELIKHFATALSAFGQPLPASATTLWLACHEVLFHVDETLGESAAFAVWQVAGPNRVLEFPSLGAALPMRVGDIVLFDGLHSHGVRVPQRAGLPFETTDRDDEVPLDESDVVVYYTMDLPLNSSLRDMLGISTRYVESGEAYGPEFDVVDQTGTLTVKRRSRRS